MTISAERLGELRDALAAQSVLTRRFLSKSTIDDLLVVLNSYQSKENAMSNPIMKHFEFPNLPKEVHGVCGDVYALACSMDAQLPDSAEKSAGLRKLLEAKDCFIRAKQS